MKINRRIRSVVSLLCVVTLSAFSIATSTAADKPVKVCILSGQSNMVGMGQVMLELPKDKK